MPKSLNHIGFRSVQINSKPTVAWNEAVLIDTTIFTLSSQQLPKKTLPKYVEAAGDASKKPPKRKADDAERGEGLVLKQLDPLIYTFP